MSSPAPVPSKAAIHALRGLLFGTSCSLVLLAEERRQRIKIARSAVENGRKIKSLKRYSSSGGAALEAVQAEVNSDPNFVGWSTRSRSRSSSHDRGTLALEGSYLNHVAHDLGPDPRHPTREARGQNMTASSSEEGTLRGRLPQYASDSARQNTLSSFADEAPRFHQSLLVRRVAGKKAIREIVDVFWKDHPHLRAPIDMEAGLTENQSQHTPSAAVRLVLRAYNSTARSQELPGWLIKLSSLLCVACQQEGDSRAAAQILDIIANHGPIGLGDYMSHRPLKLIAFLISHTNLHGVNAPDLAEQLDVAARLYSANVPDVEQANLFVRQKYTRIGKDLIDLALKENLTDNIARVFHRVRTLAENPIPETTWLIGKLRDQKEHPLAIDIFVGTYANLPKTSRSSQETCSVAVDSVLKAKGYGALEVLKQINCLRERDGWRVPSQWVKDVLGCYWNTSRSYEGTRNLFDYLSHNHFYNITNTYDFQSMMVRICLEANELGSALCLFEKLSSSYPEARKDMEILGAFAMHKASQGDWDGVRADYKAMALIQPFPEYQRIRFNRMFSTVLKAFSKDHTWGEVETFMETYIIQLGVSLDRYLVRFIADRHGRCRDLKALGRWLKFCVNAGFKTDSLFWTSIMTTCKQDWKYDSRQILDLYDELVSVGIKNDFPGIEKLVKGLTFNNPVASLNRHLVTSHRFFVADERTTFDRMRMEAQRDNWERVLSVYRRAVHNGMGHSSRCLQLAVRACVHFDGPKCNRARSLLSKAQAEGHDISNAVVPLVLAQLDEIEQDQRDTGAGALPDNRGKPYPAIKRVLDDLQDKGIHIDNNVFGRATRICLALRNYREAIILCVFAAKTNGNNDLCYSMNNFRYLLTAYTARHEYDRVRWLLEELRHRNYRYLRPCRQVLNWAIHYVRVASETDKPEKLRQSDREIGDVIAKTRDIIAAENLAFKAESNDVVLDVAMEDDPAANAMRVGEDNSGNEYVDGGREATKVLGRENILVAREASG